MAERKKATTETAGPAADKKRALETAIAQIERTYGKGSIMRLGANEQVVVESIPTGSLALDLALGIGGVPRGRIIEIYGPESSGKTTLALHIAAEAQKRGARWPSSTPSTPWTPTYARALGVDIDNMLISQPDTGGAGPGDLRGPGALRRPGRHRGGLRGRPHPRAEIEGRWGLHVGLLARLMSQALRKLAGSIAKTHCVVIFINQLREKVGGHVRQPEVTTGGRALKFYSSVRIEVRRIEAIKAGTEIIGNRTRAKVVKNKVAPLPGGGVRHHVWRGHLQVRGAGGPGGEAEHHPEERLLVLHGRGAHRPGARTRPSSSSGTTRSSATRWRRRSGRTPSSSSPTRGRWPPGPPAGPQEVPPRPAPAPAAAPRAST